MLDVRARAGKKVIEANDVRAFGEKPFAKMRPQEARAAGDQNALLKMH